MDRIHILSEVYTTLFPGIEGDISSFHVNAMKRPKANSLASHRNLSKQKPTNYFKVPLYPPQIDKNFSKNIKE